MNVRKWIFSDTNKFIVKKPKAIERRIDKKSEIIITKPMKNEEE